MSNAQKEPNGTNGACKGCGAHLNYFPGSTQVKCEYCGVQNEIIIKRERVSPNVDPLSILNEHFSIDTSNYKSIKCENCHSSVRIHPNSRAAKCPLCATPLNIDSLNRGNSIISSSVKRSELEKVWAEGQVKKPRNGCFAMILYVIIIPVVILFFIMLFIGMFKSA